jgi:phosphoadenosine phosphosulfate reductase
MVDFEQEYNKIVDKNSNKNPEELLDFIFQLHGNKVELASSFGAEDVVIIHMIQNLGLSIPIFTIDTGRLNQETYNLIDEIRNKYNIKIEILFPNNVDVETMVQEKGMNLFYKSVENRQLCCNVRKVIPLEKKLSNLDAWITGLRKNQNENRSNFKKIEIDIRRKTILKYNPLIDWSFEQVFDYIKKNNVPYNKLHDLNYPSIGCAPCTRGIKAGESPRAGRWWWENENNTECGLHSKD